MDQFEVEIEELQADTLICFNGYGNEPETEAFNKLFAWSKEHGIQGRVFGYNNPDPSEGSPNYGYDACMVVPPGTKAEGDGCIDHLKAGRYLVHYVPVRDPWKDIGTAWRNLVQWRDEHNYTPAGCHCYEESLCWKELEEGCVLELNLFLPIK